MIPGPFGNVRLAVMPQYPAVRVDHHQGIIERVVRMFEHAHRQHHGEFTRELTEMADRRASLQRLPQFEMLRRVALAEIRRLEHLLYQNGVPAASRRFADQFLGARHIGVAIPTACHLGGRYRYSAHGNRASFGSLKTWGENSRSRVRTLRVRDFEIGAGWNS